MATALEGKRILLRPLRLTDASDIYKNVNDPEITKWLANTDYPVSRARVIALIVKQPYATLHRKGYAFGIVLKETNCVIGIIRLFDLDWKDKNAMLRYWLGRRYWGRGLMAEALGLMLKFGFRKLKLHRIYAHVNEKNRSSSKLLEQNGFVLEGKKREARFEDNEWKNVLLFAMLNREYAEQCKKMA